MKHVRIEVTAEDIREGWRGTNYCPVALALDRDAGLPWRWRVTAPSEDDGLCRAWFAEGDAQPASLMPLPWSVARFVRAYDSGEPVKPFAFWIQA